jgi:hypothetical protein
MTLGYALEEGFKGTLSKPGGSDRSARGTANQLVGWFREEQCKLDAVTARATPR